MLIKNRNWTLVPTSPLFTYTYCIWPTELRVTTEIKKNIHTWLQSSDLGSRWRWKQECERRKEHRKESARPSTSVCLCVHSCDSVTTARPLDLRDCCCQSLSPLFYCETTQVCPGLRASAHVHSSRTLTFAVPALPSFAPSEHRSDCLCFRCHAALMSGSNTTTHTCSQRASASEESAARRGEAKS